MKIGFSIPISENNKNQLHYVKNLNDLGIEQFWIGDNPPVNNAFLTIEHILSRIEKITLGTGITSPFYYSKQTLVGTVEYFIKNYGKRFILGLGFGKKKSFFDSNERLDFRKFQSYTHELVETVRHRLQKNNLQDSFSYAIGGLGNSISKFAILNADIFLVNSASKYDLKRINKIFNSFDDKKKSQVFLYCMMEIREKKENISLKLWNIVKDIARNSSLNILEEHNYSQSMIEKIKQLPPEYMFKIPEGEVVHIVNDFALVGKIDELAEKVSNLMKTSKIIDGLIFGWTNEIYDYKKIADFLELL
ncbi:MAG: hypothetical protein K9W45_01700 [Candidatus Heimdallarchaeum aukensis]|uniref:Luciferase-like domain-containing protein n=1 Tax=Candidatus Heimdallarchaeum aukensis TaxID=2876573 RepID=A0A9Y1BLD0_9ARCH|nr:MAG: hypothetical protein K9W45_01700 [Candidatus Heimdallarchaeum aukensis]